MARRARPAGLPVVALHQEHFWRCVPKPYLQTLLEPGPSFTRQRRYSVRGEFSALYFSASRDLCLTEVAGRASHDSEPIACVEFEIAADRLVDLTRLETRVALRVRLEDLVRPRTWSGAYEVPQGVARYVYQAKLSGLLAPSVHDPKGEKQGWFNLVLYPANMIRSSVREVEIAEVIPPLQ
jgi:RES domain-containing protein